MATCDVTQLMADGKCFDCFSAKQMELGILQLLCDAVELAEGNPDCSALFQDNFNDGVDGQDLGLPKWGAGLGSHFVYDSGRAIEDPDGSGSIAWAAEMGTFSDGYVQAECWGETDNHEVLLRGHPVSVAVQYGAQLDPVNEAVAIRRGSTTLGWRYLPAGVGFVPGKVLRLEARGNRLTAKYDGHIVYQVVDTTASATPGPNYAGMRGSASLGAIFDNFECCSWD